MKGRAAGGPWAGVVLRDLARRLGSGWPSGLTVLTGDDAWHLDRGRRLLLEGLVPAGAAEFGLTRFEDERVSTARVVSSARSGGGMFSSRRVVYVRDAMLLEGESDKDRPEPIRAYAQAPPGDSYVVVRAPRLDRKRRLHVALVESGIVLEFRSPANDAEIEEACTSVLALANDAGVVVGRDGGRLLLERCACDFHRIEREIEKARDWAGTAPARLSVEELESLVEGGEEGSVWELADAILARDAAGAIAWARRLGRASDRSGDVLPVLGGLAWRSRVMLRAKALLTAGLDERQVLESCRAWGRLRDDLLPGVKRYTLAELLAFPARLLEADRALKGGAIDTRSVLETLARDLTAAPTRPTETR